MKRTLIDVDLELMGLVIKRNDQRLSHRLAERIASTHHDVKRAHYGAADKLLDERLLISSRKVSIQND